MLGSEGLNPDQAVEAESLQQSEPTINDRADSDANSHADAVPGHVVTHQEQINAAVVENDLLQYRQTDSVEPSAKAEDKAD